MAVNSGGSMSDGSNWITSSSSSNISITSTTGSWTGTPQLRRMFCDKPEHKMYRAIRECCPCFKGALPYGGFTVQDDKTAVELRCADGELFLVEKDGLARSFLQLFEKVQEQELLILELQNELDELRKQ